MDDNQRITLANLVKQYETEETTEKIRELKHSKRIHECLKHIVEAMRKYPRIYKDNRKHFETLIAKQTNFLFTTYPEIYHRMLDNEINMNIMQQFLYMLSRIENGELDQHEASYNIGKLLKELYIDTKLDEMTSTNYKKPKHDIDWNTFKNSQKQ
jgi:hypothetical protein